MGCAEDSSNQEAARWYARMRADCTPYERAEFEDWRAHDPGNAAAYAAAERMSDAVASLAMTDPRLKAMVRQAASAGATLPDGESGTEGPPLAATVLLGCRIARPLGCAAAIRWLRTSHVQWRIRRARVDEARPPE
jgi:ferric-dicitrate binding protein FerR (iron transport regulator)